MVTTLFLAGFPDFLFLFGRITGQYPSTYLVVSLFCFGAGFCWLMMYFWAVFLYLDFADRGSSHFSASVSFKHKENRSHLLCVQDEILSCLWLKKESAITEAHIQLVNIITCRNEYGTDSQILALLCVITVYSHEKLNVNSFPSRLFRLNNRLGSFNYLILVPFLFS